MLKRKRIMFVSNLKVRNCEVVLFLIFFCFLISLLTTDVNGEEKILSRKKRYLAFPEGASFTVSICVTIGAIGNPFVDYLSYALNWGCAYDLPNETWVIQHEHGFNIKGYMNEKTEVQRRTRRNVYEEVSTILTSMDYDGLDCIMRALCESRKFFNNRIGTMEEVLVKTIFSLPRLKRMIYGDSNLYLYDNAYRKSRSIKDCSKAYPKCGFSLIALALGKHSENFYSYM